MAVHQAGNPQHPNLLVTGASGALGYWVCRMAIHEWCVHGIHWRNPIGIAGVKAVRVDLTDAAGLKNVFSSIQPQAVIHAAAIAQPALCEADPQSSQAVNVDVSQHLSSLCAEKGLPFIFISTDLVFDGRDAPYDEQCRVSPVTLYGRQKARAETAVLQAYSGALVCRMPLMFGLGPRSSANFSMQMLSAIQKGRKIRLFTDEFRTPVDLQSAARGVLHLLGRARGILHLGGKSRISRFELGRLMARKMGILPSMLTPVTIDELSLGTTRSPDCAMTSRKAFALGYDPMPLSSAVKRVVDQFNVISNA